MEHDTKQFGGLMASRVYNLSKNAYLKCIITAEEEDTPQSIVIVIGQEEPIRS